MPRGLQSQAARVSARLQQDHKDADIGQTEERMAAECLARYCTPDLAESLLEFYRKTSYKPVADGQATDPGPWLEVWWRIQLRLLGPAGYQHATDSRSFRDKLKPLTTRARYELQRQAAEDKASGRLGNDAAHRSVDAELIGIDFRARSKILSAYLSTALLSRPHGFRSVGRVKADTALGRLLLQGLHVFLATFHDPAALLHLHKRHNRSMAINGPVHELGQYLMTYAAGQNPSTFTRMLPPAAAQVPLFDHLSLHWQLKVVGDVMTGLMPQAAATTLGPNADREDSSSSGLDTLPSDHVYNWAAFNKLLLLGMYAPVEEAASPEGSRLAAQQLQEVAAAREAEAVAAVSAMQHALAQFRCVLHEQLQSELAVGQAALQLFAAHQLDQQQDSNQQWQIKQMTQLQQQLQDCHPPALWAHNTSSSSGGSTDCNGTQQSQQLVLLVCSLLAWPLAAVGEHFISSHNVDPHQQQQQQEQQQQGDSPSISPDRQQQPSLQQLQMQQLLDAAVSGIADQHSSVPDQPAYGGIAGLLLKSVHLGTGTGQAGEQQQQQQQQQEEHQQDPQQRQPDQALIAWLLQLLVPQREATCASSLQEVPGRGGEVGHGSQAAAAAAAHSCSGCSCVEADPAPAANALQLQAFTRCLCHVLLVRLLSSAPPCEAWSWEVCLAVLQLLVSMEMAANAAAAVLLEGAANDAVLHASIEPDQQQQHEDEEAASAGPGANLPAGHVHCLQNRQLEAYIDKLLSMLQNLQQADIALGDCNTGSGSRSGRDPLHVQQQQEQQQQEQAQSSLLGSRPSSASRSSSGAGCSSSAQRRRLQEQQLEEFSEPTWWRSQALTLYKRKGGSTWLEQFLSDATVDNHRPGFWGLVGKFAASDQLNLRYAEVPTAVAAVQPAVLSMPDEPVEVQNMCQQAALAKQLARLANSQLLTKYIPASFFGQGDHGIPVQPMALKSLLRCALLGAQQPQTLAFANAPLQDLHAAAAAAAQRRPAADAEGDSPLPSTELSDSSSTTAASGADAAAAAAAASAAAAAVWQELPGLHLSSLLALGPLFAESQQGPCLVRFMQLLLQYHEDMAAAASAAMQRVAPELRKRGLCVPKCGTGSSSRSHSYSSNGSSSSPSEYIPTDRSRLLVLLMGLYHLGVLEEQQERQHKQQWQQEQRQQEEEWGRKHGSSLGVQHLQQAEGQVAQAVLQQQQHQQQPRQLRLSRTAPDTSATSTSASSAAAATPAVGSSGATGLCESMQDELAMVYTAVESAYAMHELLLYCLTPMEQLSAGGTGSAGSSSSRQQRVGARRFEVCAVSKALLDDGTNLLAQPDPRAACAAKMATCDACCARSSLQNASTGARAFLGPLHPSQVPPPAAIACLGCDGHAWFCKNCGKEDSTAWQQHKQCCDPEGGAVQQAWVCALAAACADNNVQLDREVCASNVSTEGRCKCSTCLALLASRCEHIQNCWMAAPMVQYSGPWQPEQQQQQQQQAPGVLPQSLACQLQYPPYIVQVATRAAGELPRSGFAMLRAFCDPLLEAVASFMAETQKVEHEVDQQAQAAATPEASNPTNSTHSASPSSSSSSGAAATGGRNGQWPQGGQRGAGQGSSSTAEATPSSLSSSSAAAATGSPAAQHMSLAGLGAGFLGPRPQRKQQEQQQQQEAGRDAAKGGYADYLRAAYNAAQQGAQMVAGAVGWADDADSEQDDVYEMLLEEMGMKPNRSQEDLLQELMQRYDVSHL